MLDKVYQVVEQVLDDQTIYGTYSTEEKANKRRDQLIKDNICEMEYVGIKEIQLDVDVEE